MPEMRSFLSAVTRSRPLVRAGAGILVLGLALLLAVGCGKGKGPAGQGEAAASLQGGPGGPGGRMNLPPIPVAVEPAQVGSISSYYAATATLEANQQAEILARTSGVILSIRAEEGDRVKEGDTLLKIEDQELKFRLKQAEAEAAKQKTKFERLQKMFESNLVSADEFETGKNDLQAAEAARDLAQLELSYTRVTAPFSGRIVRRLVDAGQNVSSGTPLFEIADLDRLLAKVHVPAKEFRNIKTDQPVELRLDSATGVLEGRITLVSPVIEATSGTIKVTVEIPKVGPDTRPGDFAEVRIVTDRHPDALLVPRTAVITDKGEQVVYVARDSTAERRVVETGFESDESIEIKTGVAENERVVVQGQRSLKHGSPIKILDRMEFENTSAAKES